MMFNGHSSVFIMLHQSNSDVCQQQPKTDRLNVQNCQAINDLLINF